MGLIELPPGPFGTIVADPPWSYRTKRITTTSNTPATMPDAESQYPTLTDDEIAELPVESISARDAHLYLWTTNPKLPVALGIVEAWGFRYVTLVTWKKLGTLGLGYYFRGDTEHAIFAVRGKAPIAPALRVRNFFEARKVGHSIKPPELQAIAERVSPGPRVELFARRELAGWTTWGNEVVPR